MAAGVAMRVEELRHAVAERFGLELDPQRAEAVLALLQEKLHDLGTGSPDEQLRWLLRSPDGLRQLAPELTVGETYFFRHPEQLDAVVATAIPDRMARRAPERTLRIVSAGCAGGEELYSVAILLRERVPELLSWDLHLEGLDVNPTMVEKARRAEYTSWSLRRTPPALQASYFLPRGGRFCLRQAIRDMARFEVRNLLERGEELWSPGSVDVILCRNVLMYFTPPAASAIVARFEAALAPGGFLFLGSAESLRDLSEGFATRDADEAFFYQRLEPARAAAPPPPARHGPPPPPLPAIAPAAAPPKVAELLELLRQERFADVLAAIPEGREDRGGPELALLRAVALSGQGEDTRAEQLARELVDRDPLDAEAHYLLALCRQRLGDPAGAQRHAEIAAYLDPTFSLPHLQLGILWRRRGNARRAQHELEQAEALVQSDDEERLVLFGGGFNREALIALCRAQREGGTHREEAS